MIEKWQPAVGGVALPCFLDIDTQSFTRSNRFLSQPDGASVFVYGGVKRMSPEMLQFLSSCERESLRRLVSIGTTGLVMMDVVFFYCWVMMLEDAFNFVWKH